MAVYQMRMRPEEHARLRARAARRGVSMAELIRLGLARLDDPDDLDDLDETG